MDKVIYCARTGRWTVCIVSNDELDNPTFLADVRAFAANLRIPPGRFVDWLVDGHRDARVKLVDSAGQPADIDYEEIERENINFWFRDWARMPVRHVQPRVRLESRERVRLVATLLRMLFPKESTVWGRSFSQDALPAE